MNWLYYLLEANLYMLVFYAFYRLFLHDETFYSSNRYFLLCSSLIAFVLPLVQVGLLKPEPLIATPAYQPIDPNSLTILTDQPIGPATFDFALLIYPLYLLIAAGFAFKLIMSVIKIFRLWINAEKQRSGDITLVKLQNSAAFSFFNLLFIHPQLVDKKAVVAHEMVHINQKHSFDILLFEILQVLCWFNPIIYFIKKDIKLLHEYIADELSTNAAMQKHEYAMFLIENSFGVSQTALTNQIFNQSILKRRINMLNKKRTAGRARLRLLLAIPLTMGMLCASTMAFTKDYGYIDLLPENSTSSLAEFQSTPHGAETKQDVPKTNATNKKKPPLKSNKGVPSKGKPSASTKTTSKNAVIGDDSPATETVRAISIQRRDSLKGVRIVNRSVINLKREVRDSLRAISIRNTNRNENSNQRIHLRDDSARRINLKLRKTAPLNGKLTGVRVRGYNNAPTSAGGTSPEVINIRVTNSTKPITVSGYKTAPTKINGTQTAGSPEVIEVRAISPTTKVQGIMIQPSQTVGTAGIKEVVVTGYPTKPKEVIEVKILPTVKGTPIPTKGNN